MPQITNADLKQEIEGLKIRMGAVEGKMKAYETKADANHALLERVERLMRTVIFLGKWLLGVVSGVVIIVLGYWLLGVLHIHP